MKNITKHISSEWIAWCVLLVIIVFTGTIRYSLLSVPLERDEGEYAYAGQLILQGIPPYLAVCNMKLPGIYAAYAFLLAVFGQTHQGIHAGLLIINAITTIIIFLLAKHITNPLGAIVSAASFALLSVSQSVQGIFANAEHFVILFATGGLLVMLWGLAKASLCRLFVSGLLLGLSFVMKQHGLAFSIFAALYIVFDSLRQRPLQWRVLVLRLLSFVAGFIAIFACLCMIMAWAGVFRNFWFWTVDYACAYLSQVPFEQAWQNFVAKAMGIVRPAPLLWTLIGLGFFAIVTKRIAEHHRKFLAMYAIFSILSICPGFYFRPHYFVLLLPCASLFAGNAISALSDFLLRFSSKKIQYGIPIFLIVACLSQSIYQQHEFLFQMTPFQVSRSTYGLNPFPESLKIAGFIQKRTNPEDRIAILGSEPQIYFYSRRRSATSYIYMYPLMENHDFALQMQKDFISNIEENPPKYLIVVNVPTSWLRRIDSHMMLHEWLQDYQKNFRLVGVIELFIDKSIYYWEQNVKWPVSSEYWIVVLERSIVKM